MLIFLLMSKKQQCPMREDPIITKQLEELLTPAITTQENYYRKLIYKV